MGTTLAEKVWADHLVRKGSDGAPDLLYIDLMLMHEVTSPQAFEGLRLAGRKPWRESSIVATADHNTPTTGWEKGLAGITDPIALLQVETLDKNMKSICPAAYFPFMDKGQGVIHVMGPEEGATLPGMTVVCGDSHTSTHGACAALAFGIGTSEVEHVLATQTLITKKNKNMLVRVEGKLGPGITGNSSESRSMRISRGPSELKLKPRSAESIWSEETPMSMRAPSTASQPIPSSAASNSL